MNDEVKRKTKDKAQPKPILKVQRKPMKSKKKKTKVVNESVNAYWTLAEKEKLLRAIKRHGLSKSRSSLEQISDEIGSKDPSQIEHCINQRLNHLMKNSEVSNKVPINFWIDKAKRNSAQKLDFSSALTPVFEKIMQPDFTEIYQYISCLLKGEYPPDLSPESAHIAIRLLTDLAGLIRLLDVNNIIEDVKTDLRKGSKTDGEQPAESSNEESSSDLSFYEKGFLEDGSDLPTLNPLKLSPKLLRETHQKAIEAWNENRTDPSET